MNAAFSLIASRFKIERASVNTFRLLMESSQFLYYEMGLIRRGADFNVIIIIVAQNYAGKEYVATLVLFAFLSFLLMEFRSTQHGFRWKMIYP